MQRLAIFIGSLLAAIVFALQFFTGQDLLYASWMSLMVLMFSTVIIMFSMKWVGNVLMDHLKKQRDEVRKQAMSMKRGKETDT